MTKKKSLILNVLTFLILFFCYNVKAQEKKNVENIYKVALQNTTWITDKILGLNENTEQYNLTKFILRRFVGNLTSFGENLIFKSEYVAPCGNDNFTTVTGKYEFLDNEKLIISVDSVTYSGEWKMPNEHRESKEIVFLISKIGETIILTKQQ